MYVFSARLLPLRVMLNKNITKERGIFMTNKTLKKILSLGSCIALTLAFSACGSSDQPAANGDNAVQQEQKQEEKVLSLVGTWKQTNANSETTYHKAVITEDRIEVYWIMEDADTEALYWAGTYEAPTTSDKKYTWDSANDTEATSSALLASSDPTKTFTYDDGVLSYSASAMGVTQTVELELVQ